ncbi:hypothetical protein O6H91_Y578600 [Diphasiastrum complanatum]|nr:hypothetical protein O6H91_Y578600 [Diphasiastrum complanatum]
MVDVNFFTEYGEANRYKIQEVIGKGSYGVVCSAIDTHTGEKVAIKKINDIFEHVSDATRILREIKLLRLLRHPDIVEVKHIMLPPSPREFKDIYVVFELMESDLHQVIKANDDLTPEHYQFFLYQLLRALKYIHTGRNQLMVLTVCTFEFISIVCSKSKEEALFQKNVLANADCKLKICDFGLARVAFSDAPTAIFWTDYVATRWYRAPELCGSFYSKYTPAIDIWSIGCIFAEVLIGRPLFPGKNVVHQLDLMTDMLGTPSAESIARIRNEKAKRYLSSMRKKLHVPFSQKFSNADPLALRLLERLLAFDPKDRPSAEEALADPYFKGLAKVEREPSAQPITKMEFEFERRRINKDDVRELIYREHWECYLLVPYLLCLKEYLNGTDLANFMYPSAVDQFKRQFAHLEEHFGKGGTADSFSNISTLRCSWNRSLIKRAIMYIPVQACTFILLPALLYSNMVPAVNRIASSVRDHAMDYREDASKYNRESDKYQQERTIPFAAKANLHTSQQVLFSFYILYPEMCCETFLFLELGYLRWTSKACQRCSDSRRLVKSASISGPQYLAPIYSYTRRNYNVSSERDIKRNDSASELDAVRSRTDSMGIGVTRKVAAIQGGRT